ncbi:MAG: MBL fold metallo-hydrolase [Deltaproteobacteria bacterium]|nr:MBL fold metallo-hydrolase [Deltaproteobacteria bacterium]
MRLTVLGSGTAVPLRDRSSPSLVVWLQNGPVVLDLGPGTLRQMTRVGIRHETLRHIFLTHFHPDHTGDLVHFLFATRNPDVLRHRATVVIAGAIGLNAFIGRLQNAWGDWLTLPPELMKVHEFALTEKLETEYGDFTVVTSPVVHTPHSLAYRLTDREGRSVVFSGDTGYCQALVDLSTGADLLVLEASFPEGQAVEGHLTPAEAGRVAAEAGVQRLVLTHFYPEVLATDIEAQCRRSYGGELIPARDLMDIEV